METGQVNILLVDDQPAKLMSYEVILEELGERIFKADSARNALEILLKNDFAVILVDVCMPEFDGFELAAMLREHPRYENTAVLFISAVNLTEVDLARGYQLGAVDYVSVPVVPEILRAKVRVFVELYRKTHELERLNAELEQRVRERTFELQETNGRLRESEERLRLASEAAEFGTYDYNVSADSMHCSPHLKKMLGTTIPGEMSLAAFLALVDAGDVPALHDAMSSAKADDGQLHETEFRPLGGSRWLLNRGRSFPPGPGSVDRALRTMGTILDITQRKQLEERQRLLIAELDHRVKNVMANVSAMAQLSGHRAKSVGDFVSALLGRLQSMASAHALLSQTNWNSVGLHELALAVLAPFRSQRGDNIVIAGDSLSLRPRIAQDLALVLHELATNAVKYGALSSPDGKVHLTWTHDNVAGTSRIEWRESGGPPVKPPAKRGLGLSIIDSALAESGSKVKCAFPPEGVNCILEGSIVSDWNGPTASPVPGTMTLPERTARPARDWQTPLRILLVEDAPLVARQLQYELEQQGHVVLGPVADATAGLQLAQSDELDVALLDINLGRETSIEIANVLHSRGIPFAFATAYTDSAILPAHHRDRPRLIKPYASEDIRRVVRRLSETALKADSPQRRK